METSPNPHEILNTAAMDQLDKITDCLRIAKECRVHAAVAAVTLRGLAASLADITLAELWRLHGLSERSSNASFDARLECLEKWLDLLYGNGTALSSRVRERLKEKKGVHAQARLDFHLAGGHVSLADAIDSLVRELSGELPSVGKRTWTADEDGKRLVAQSVLPSTPLGKKDVGHNNQSLCCENFSAAKTK